MATSSHPMAAESAPTTQVFRMVDARTPTTAQKGCGCGGCGCGGKKKRQHKAQPQEQERPTDR